MQSFETIKKNNLSNLVTTTTMFKPYLVEDIKEKGKSIEWNQYQKLHNHSTFKLIIRGKAKEFLVKN